MIIQIRAHGSFCEYNSFKQKIIEDPTQDILLRTDILDILGNIQLLSTQPAGRYGFKSFEKRFLYTYEKIS